MKYLIASDLHGSARYCRALLEMLRREQADRLVLLGDLLYHGPRNPLPEEYDTQSVAAMLGGVAERVLCVRGNCDSEVDQMILPFPMLADYALLSLEGVELFATHGHLYGPDAQPPIRWAVSCCAATRTCRCGGRSRASPTSTPAPWPCRKRARPTAAWCWKTASSPGGTSSAVQPLSP